MKKELCIRCDSKFQSKKTKEGHIPLYCRKCRKETKMCIIKNEEEINEPKLLKEIGRYLESKGWKALVIGFSGIHSRKLKYKYSLIIDFTGKQIRKDGDL